MCIYKNELYITINGTWKKFVLHSMKKIKFESEYRDDHFFKCFFYLGSSKWKK